MARLMGESGGKVEGYAPMPSRLRIPSSPQPMTTLWFQAKTGRRTGASARCQGFVTSTCQS